jgi:hypothetical protein
VYSVVAVDVPSNVADSDGNLVSVDSLGRTQFWDTAFGTLLQGYRQHEADVLAVVVDPTLHIVYAAGIDNKVVQFRCVPHTTMTSFSPASASAGASDSTSEVDMDAGAAMAWKWIPVASARAHAHDVRALAVVPPRVRKLRLAAALLSAASEPQATSSAMTGMDIKSQASGACSAV